ncbi:MAG: hypothetical protein HYW86_00105 [Candidatus Roizmanbacteria bacterium]|nr:MAG: hypothetical protein HYW86_00105 [Candidatus Roizmanbacteria bacterium]
MKKFILNLAEVQELVAHNSYTVSEKQKFLSRCIDGRYENSSDLPALGIPGGDLGDLAIIAAAGNEFGFEVNLQKTSDTLIEFVGGVGNFSFHTDSHAVKNLAAGGCGHIKLITTENEAYKVTKEQAESIKKTAQELKEKGANEVVLHGDHMEGAVLVVRGDYGIKPQYELQTDEGGIKKVQVFIFHRTLVDSRHKELSQKLIENKAVKLFENQDAEYLYEVLSEETDNHLFETARHLAKNLRIFEVNFKNNGEYEVKEVGIV